MPNNVRIVENDNMSNAFEDMVPERYKDTDNFLNIVQWNIEWFGARKSSDKDRHRVSLVTKILESFNADLFIFQEVAGPSKDGRYPGVLDGIAQELTQRGTGDYVVFYTNAGGEQRVAMMWDRDYLRAKSDVEDLFERGTYKKTNKKDPFAGRTPLYGHFEAKIEGLQRFDFQALGVHLKAMPDGAPQRKESAKILSSWIKQAREEIDADILIAGDWNAPPNAAEWDSIESLDDVSFRTINDESDFSYLWLKNKTSKYVSRIDLSAISLASDSPLPQMQAEVVRWRPIEEALSRTTRITDSSVRRLLNEIKESVSDHLPTITQFYVEKPQNG